jgi:hypothetical protein
MITIVEAAKVPWLGLRLIAVRHDARRSFGRAFGTARARDTVYREVGGEGFDSVATVITANRTIAKPALWHIIKMRTTSKIARMFAYITGTGRTPRANLAVPSQLAVRETGRSANPNPDTSIWLRPQRSSISTRELDRVVTYRNVSISITR